MVGAKGTIVVATSIFPAPIERWERQARAIKTKECSREEGRVPVAEQGNTVEVVIMFWTSSPLFLVPLPGKPTGPSIAP